MIQKLISKITDLWIGTDIDQEDWEVYQFGIGIIVSTALEIVTILILGLLFKQFFGTCLFLFWFILLRRNIGGYHANSYERCYLVMILVYLLSYACVALTPLSRFFPVTIVLSFISLIVILFLGPIDNENKPWPEERRKKAKRIGDFISLIQIVCIVAVGIIFPSRIVLSYWMALSLFSTATLLAVAHFLATRKKSVR